MRDSPLSESLWFGPGRTLARPGPFHVLQLRQRRPWRYEGQGPQPWRHGNTQALSYGKMEVGPPRNGIAYKREHGHDGRAWGRLDGQPG